MSTKAMVEAGVVIALSQVLAMIKVYRLPQGGSVTAGSMIPLIALSLRWGPGVGILAGTVYGVVHQIIDPYMVHPVQFLLDYPIAFGALGLAGFFRKKPIIGATVAIAGRLLAHVVSGIVFFGSYAPKGTPVWLYSLSYNASYLVPEVIISAVVIYLLSRSPVLDNQMQRARR